MTQSIEALYGTYIQAAIIAANYNRIWTGNGIKTFGQELASSRFLLFSCF